MYVNFRLTGCFNGVAWLLYTNRHEASILYKQEIGWLEKNKNMPVKELKADERFL